MSRNIRKRAFGPDKPIKPSDAVAAEKHPQAPETDRLTDGPLWLTKTRVLAAMYGAVVIVAFFGTILLLSDNDERSIRAENSVIPLDLPPRHMEKQVEIADVVVPQTDHTQPLPLPEPEVTAPAEQEAWIKYAVLAPATSGPRIAIVIDDVGPDLHGARRAIKLDPNVTLAFLPYARNVEKLTGMARKAGHELLVHMPMQPTSTRQDPGPSVLKVELPKVELLRNLDWNLTRFEGYVGINNHMGSEFTTHEPVMAAVLGELKARGLLFLDSRTTEATVGRKVAEAIELPFVERDIFIDNVRTDKAIRRQLEKIEAIAAKHGSVVAIGHPHDVTLENLELWIATLSGKGMTLVPLSAIVRERSVPAVKLARKNHETGRDPSALQ